MSSIVWFRKDLRTEDHAPLLAACARSEAVIPVYIHSPDEEGGWPPGGASKWWLHHSLLALEEALRQLGSRLIIRQGDTLFELQRLAEECGAKAVFWGRRYEPASIARDREIKLRLRDAGLLVESFNTSLLWEPWTIQTGGGECYRVFTPFWRKCVATGGVATPLPAPAALPAPAVWPGSLSLARLELEPRKAWDTGLRETWRPGAAGALQVLELFSQGAWCNYKAGRDLPAQPGTSRLSPHLHFGEVSPRQVWHSLRDLAAASEQGPNAADPYLRQLVWREFAHHLLFHFPRTPREPLREEFARFPWRDDERLLALWRRGRTGYPWVDAGMRELWRTGWMHNRVRMATASFLVKDLLIPWQRGAEWFWDTLVDADLANNTLGWQWTAGCGADAAPYFRVFNPVLQGEKFDTGGDYVRRHLPELARLPDRWIHRPFEAPASILSAAGVELGVSYPRPIVDHSAARLEALAALSTITNSANDQG